MHVPRKLLDLFEGSRRQNAVPEIEDVAGPPAGPPQHIVCRRVKTVGGAEEQRRIEVALHRTIRNPRPGFVERLAPVDADHVAAGSGKILEDGGGADAEMNE